MRFLNRKHAEKVLRARKKLRDIDTSDIWGENRVHFVSENLSPEYLRLRWVAKKLKNANVISEFGVNKNGIWLKKGIDERRVQVDIEEDFISFIPSGKNLADYL